MSRKTTADERYSIIPPMGSKYRTLFASDLDSAIDKARTVAAESPEGKTEIIFRTNSGYIDIGYFDYYGKFTRASDGSLVGGDHWSRSSIALPDDRYAEQITRARAISRLARFDWKALSTQTLVNVLALLPAPESKTGD